MGSQGFDYKTVSIFLNLGFKNLELIKNSVPLKVNRLGRGKVILFTDNTNFRAFWYGTNKLLANAIFFGDSM